MAQPFTRCIGCADPRGESAGVVHEPKFSPGKPLNATQLICGA